MLVDVFLTLFWFSIPLSVLLTYMQVTSLRRETRAVLNGLIGMGVFDRVQVEGVEKVVDSVVSVPTQCSPDTLVLDIENFLRKQGEVNGTD